jgi:hypothetical protein
LPVKLNGPTVTVTVTVVAASPGPGPGLSLPPASQVNKLPSPARVTGTG